MEVQQEWLQQKPDCQQASILLVAQTWSQCDTEDIFDRFKRNSGMLGWERAQGIRSKKRVLAAVAVTVVITVAVVLGTVLSKSKATSPEWTQPPGQHTDVLDLFNSSEAPHNEFRQLPSPGTAESRQLLANPLTPGWVRDIYHYYDDADLITPEASSLFLEQLQQHQGLLEAAFQQQQNQQQQQQQLQSTAQALLAAADGVQSSSSKSSSPPAAAEGNSSLDLVPFVRVASDMLGYLRYSRSQSLLMLLRGFSTTGTLVVEDADPDALQQEVSTLLNVTKLNQWYRDTGRSDEVGSAGKFFLETDQHAAGGAVAAAVHSALQQQRGRRLHTASSTQQQQQQQQQLWRRRLQATAAAAMPAIPDAAVSGARMSLAANRADNSSLSRAPAGIPTVSPQQSLQDMLCGIQSFSPSGLQGVLQQQANTGKAGVPQCPRRKLGLFAYKSVVFQPVELPVVFHCLRYKQGKVLMPPLWDPVKSAQNLIDVANRLYIGTGIRFKLHEVRHDPAKHPYLLLPTVDDWQSCTANPRQQRQDYPCLSDLASSPSVAQLASSHIISIFVSGSKEQPHLCDTSGLPPSVCTRLFSGLCKAAGPWFSEPSEAWREHAAGDNWVYMTFDMFDPKTKNSQRFWNGGGCTLAHELGHYLGLMHTHEGEQPCDGNGLTRGDAVPDTPENKQVDEYAAASNLLGVLSGWCSDFRTGKQPNAKELGRFNSCPENKKIDNVFNVMSYVPDACCMLFTPNQIARMQWAIASFRPQMMAAHSI